MALIYDPTVLNSYQDKAVQKEFRPSEHGLIKLFKDQTDKMPDLTPELKQFALNVSGRDIVRPQLAEDVITTATSETFDIPANYSTSDTDTLTKVTIFAGFSVAPYTLDNNMISPESYIAAKMQEVDKAMAKKLEEYMDTHLDNVKTLVWDGASNSEGYSFESSKLKITKDAQKSRIFEHIKEQAGTNDWDISDLAMVRSFGMGDALAAYNAYGVNNEKNLQGEWPAMYQSNRVTRSSGVDWTAYLLEGGSVGILENITPEFRDRVKIGDHAVWDVLSYELPYLGFRPMIYMATEKADMSQLHGESSHKKMTIKQDFGFIFNLYLLDRYNSDTSTRPGYVLKIDGLKS